ncbi:FAD/NAD(P)-binding domain-containing protein [Chiua virens]|nr:FAD/NAD(P)-binding domain-containing protein [Chiua virens]
MSFPGKTTVLIVGAGPTGLTAALSLLQHGRRDFIIIDALPQGQNNSRSLLVYPATLEALDTIGCGDDLISQGVKGTVPAYGSRSRRLLKPSNLEWLKSYSRHPYVVWIPQNVTERVLGKKLVSYDVTVHRPLKVVGIKRNAENPQLSDATLEDGRVITAKYVIGADGACSTVRRMAGIGFSDPKEQMNGNAGQRVAADVIFDRTVAVDLVAGMTFLENHRFLCIPLPYSFNEALATNGKDTISEDIYRIGCGILPGDEEVRSAPKEYLQKIIDRYGPYALSSDSSVNPTSNPPRIKEVIWFSRFRARAAIADTMFTRLGGVGAGESEDPEGGAILLIGDAAHIHSPIGGQGMNLGIRDAVFLGGALMKHMHASETQPLPEADVILHDFAAERYARALEVIKFTKKLTPEVMDVEKKTRWWLPIDSDTVQTWTLWLLNYIPFFQRKMEWELSGLGRR